MPVARANSRNAGAAPTRATQRRAGGQRLGVDHRAHHVLGQLDVGRPGLLGLRDLERLAHDLRDDPRVGQARVPLGHGLEHRDDVDVLMGLLVHALEVALARDRDER
jgi:hypothetical protein